MTEYRDLIPVIVRAGSPREAAGVLSMRQHGWTHGVGQSDRQIRRRR